MKRRKILVAMLIAVLCCGMLICLTSCEPLIFVGSPTYGVTTNGVSQIELKSVDYQYNINDYPKRYDEEVLQTKSYVSVTYNYYNATSSDITMPLYLVAGKPEYLRREFNDIDSYTFTTTAEQEVVLRCALSYDAKSYYNGDSKTRLDNFLKCVYDERQTDDIYNGDLSVYKYTFALSDLAYKVDHILFEINDEYENIKIFFDGEHNSNSDHIEYLDGVTSYYAQIYDTEAITLYSVGKDLVGIEDTVKFSKANVVVENGGKVTSVTKDVLTFDDLLMTYYDEESSLSATDWYNAALSEVINCEFIKYPQDLDLFDISDRLAYMYQCNLVVPAQGDVALTVKMPIYPTIDGYSYDENVYEYVLDLSALSNWRGTPDVNVIITTDGYYVKSSLDLKETATGFESKKIDSSTNLSFTLSEVPNFDKDKDSTSKQFNSRVLYVLLIIIGIIYLIPIVTVSIVLVNDRAKRKREKALKENETTTMEL